MTKLTVLSLLKFTEDQLDKLKAVSADVEVHQITGANYDDIPLDLGERLNVIYGWEGAIREAHRFPNVHWIQTHSAGVNFLIDRPVWQSNTIITSMNGVHAVPMAEYSIGMMLAFLLKIPKLLNYQRNQEWPRDRWDNLIMPELRGSTLGVIGYGAIGREIARQGHALGMRVLAINRSGKRTAARGFQLPGTGDPNAEIPEEIYSQSQLLEMLPVCDFVVCLVPAHPQTRHLFGQAAFKAMKSSAHFINISRGSLVDEDALVTALTNGDIAGAALDVFEAEPLPADSPLWSLENLVISPHVSGFSPHYDDRATDLFAENIRRYLNQEPLLNLVEREKGY